jgi:hypothetical protein
VNCYSNRTYGLKWTNYKIFIFVATRFGISRASHPVKAEPFYLSLLYSSRDPPHTINGAQFRVRVSNAYGSTLSNAAMLSVTSDRPPVGHILTPAQGTTYFGGMVVNYSGSASDFEDGDLPASAFTWQVDFHHNTHIHPFIAATTGSKTGTFTIPNRGETSANVFYRLILKVEDSAGLTHIVSRDILPRKADMTFATHPAGLQITLDGQNRMTPFTVTGVVGIKRAIAAPSPQTLNGLRYVFQSWSDGGAISHEISTPSVNTTYTANFIRPAVAADEILGDHR